RTQPEADAAELLFDRVVVFSRRRRHTRSDRDCSSDVCSSDLGEEAVAVIAHARIANRYGLFAVMTEARYEIEFQGTRDGVTWEEIGRASCREREPSAGGGDEHDDGLARTVA